MLNEAKLNKSNYKEEEDYFDANNLPKEKIEFLRKK